MIRLDVKQGSPEWIAARLGIPTASQFHRIVTPGRKPSAGAHGYMCELLAEKMLGASLDPFVSEWMERGSDLEEQAVRYYELQTDSEVGRVGFCMLDDRSAGASPDGLVGTDGGMELKCPTAANHVANMLQMTTKYACQAQGGMLITGRSWWDLMSFHPELPPVIVRIKRDEAYMVALATGLESLRSRMTEAETVLSAMVEQ